MPYDKIKGHSECGRNRIAVVSPSGKVVGCHDTEESANEQIAALMAKEDEKKDEDHALGRWVDTYAADRVLSGEPILLLPIMESGYYRWGAYRDPITIPLLQQIAANFEQGVSGQVSRPPLNVEHNDEAGKIGSIVRLEVGPEGLYAIFELTSKGTELLRDGAFDYLSPEIVWDFEDIKTGQNVGPVLVGAAVTNYPFFGDSTAMYSESAAQTLIETFAGAGASRNGGGEVFALAVDAQAMVADLGLAYSDLDNWEQEPILALMRLHRGRELSGRRRMLYALALCEAQQDGDAYYPASAYLDTSGTPWRFRVKSFLNDFGRLEYDGRLIQQAHDEMAVACPDLLGVHGTLFERYGIQIRHMEEMTMTENVQDGAAVTVEDFTALRQRTDEQARQIEQLTQQVVERDSRLEQMRQQQVIERFSREAEAFTALGVEVSDYASHMGWLQHADAEGEHVEWFRTTLQAADQALAQSAAFRSVGTSEQAPSGSDPFARIQSLMEARARERGVQLAPGTTTYNEIMTEVMNQNPALFETYRQGLISSPSDVAPEP